MSVLEIILTIGIIAAVAAVIAVMVGNRKKGKCSCGCSACTLSDCPHRK